MDQAGKFNATKFFEKSKNSTNNFCALKNFSLSEGTVDWRKQALRSFLTKTLHILLCLARDGKARIFSILSYLLLFGHARASFQHVWVQQIPAILYLRKARAGFEPWSSCSDRP